MSNNQKEKKVYTNKGGKINALCFPLYRARNPIEVSTELSKKDLENVSKYPNFVGTLEEFREFLQTAPQVVEEVHEVKVPVEEPKPIEIPEEAYEWEEEELKDYEESLEEDYSEYDDDSFYENEKTFSSHKKNWN